MLYDTGMLYEVFYPNRFPLMCALGAVFGAAFFYAWPTNPAITEFCGLLILFGSAYWGMRKKSDWALMMLLFAGAFFAFWGVSHMKVSQFGTPLLSVEYENNRYWVTGEVSEKVEHPEKTRLILSVYKIYGIPEKSTPHKIRISAHKSRLEDVQTGDWLSLEAKLYNAGTKQFPKDWDYRKYLYFKGIGATGYVMGQIYSTQPMWKNPVPISGIVADLREKITQRIESTDLPHADVISALITGERRTLSQEKYQIFQKAGLAHLLAISGLHIGLIGGLMFVLSRKIIGIHPYIIYNFSTKKIAATIGIFGCLFYMFIAGATLPTIRATFMLTLLFIGFLWERERISLRALSTTTICVLALWPESVLSASFQMSFIAAFSLIMWAESREKLPHSNLKVMKGISYTKAVFASSLIAGLATLPFAAFHFNTFTLLGFLTNLIAIPIMGFWVMPWGLIALFIMPIHLEYIPLWIMNQGVSVIFSVSSFAIKTPLSTFSIESSHTAIIGILSCISIIAFIYKKHLISIICIFILSLFTYFIPFTQTPTILHLGENGIALIENNILQEIQTIDPSVKSRILQKYAIKEEGIIHSASCDTVGCGYEINKHHFLVMNNNAHQTLEDCFYSDFIVREKSVYHCKNNKLILINNKAATIDIHQSNIAITPMEKRQNRYW